MKKRSVIAFLCACGFSLSYFSFPILAATVSTVTSNATVTFTPGTEPTGPVDPDDPSKPLDPPGQGTGESGPLSIDYVPNITFGSQAISGSQKVYNASELKPFVQVTDIRGTGAELQRQHHLMTEQLTALKVLLLLLQVVMLFPQIHRQVNLHRQIP